MENDATEITKKIEEKEKDSSDLFDRMDEDFKLWDLVKVSYPSEYKLTTKVPTGTHETDVEVVSNDPRTFSDKVQARLSDAEMQIIVRMAEAEGEDKREEIGKLERLFYFALDKGDEMLRTLLLPPLREQLIWYSLVRGWLAGRFLVYKGEGKDVIFDLKAWDPRWVTYEVGANGLLWAAYKTFRSQASLLDEYDYEPKKKRDNVVIDYWKFESEGKISNAVICDKKFLKGPDEPDSLLDLPSMPILIMPVATRPPIAGSLGGEAKGYGESVFAAIRGINTTRNKFASIAATHANILSKQPMINYYGEQGIQLHTTPYLAEAVINLPEGHNRLEAPQMKELSPTVVGILDWLSAQMERGTLPNVPIDKPPPSGTLYNLVQEAGNKVFNPQLKNLSYFYADICRLIEEQLITGKLNVKVKQEEKRKYYETQVKPVDLKRSHVIRVEFTARTPWTQLDTYQVADMAKRLGLPDAFIHEYILKLPDPKGLADLSAIEMAEHSPKLAMVRAIEALMKAGREDEAEQVMQDLYQMVLAEQMATAPPTSEPAEGEEEEIVPPVEGT